MVSMSTMGTVRNRVAIATIGCKTNQCDSAGIISNLTERGYEVVPLNGQADYVIINTCTVTSRAGAQSRQLVRQARRASPRALIVMTGCHVQAFPEESASLAEADIYLGNREKERLADFLHKEGPETRPVHVSSLSSPLPPMHPATTGIASVSRTRPFLKIQDGCEEPCSYCIVPRVRGACRSVPEEEVLKKLALLRKENYHEVVLTGINLGCYGKDLSPPKALVSLLASIENAQLIPRIRISSIEPKEWTGKLINLFSTSPVLCPHLHIPVQSGDDDILGRMNRSYGREEVRSLLMNLLKAIPDVAIGLDIITGFPGEGDGHFHNTVNFIQELPVTYLHVFPFSARSGTPAASFSDQVPVDTVQERSRILRNISKEKRFRFAQRFLGKSLPVLVLGPHQEKGYSRGLTTNYISVLIRGAEKEYGREIACTISSVQGEIVYAVPDRTT